MGDGITMRSALHAATSDFSVDGAADCRSPPPPI